MKLEIEIISQPEARFNGDTNPLAAISINGVLHHLELIPTFGSDGEPQTFNSADEERMEAIMRFDDGGYPFCTITDEDGQQYVAILTPYND